MKRTTVWELLVPFLLIGVIVYVLLRVSYGSLPPLGYFAPVPLAALALAEFVAARRVRAAVRHEPLAKPMTAIVIARCVALGKASSIVGSAVTGAGVALLIRLVPDVGQLRAAANDARVGALLVAAAVLVTIAGLLLERAGVDPNRDMRDGTGQPS